MSPDEKDSMTFWVNQDISSDIIILFCHTSDYFFGKTPTKNGQNFIEKASYAVILSPPHQLDGPVGQTKSSAIGPASMIALEAQNFGNI